MDLFRQLDKESGSNLEKEYTSHDRKTRVKIKKGFSTGGI